MVMQLLRQYGCMAQRQQRQTKITLSENLTVPVKYVRNDTIIPFSRVERTRALTIMPGTKRSMESPFKSLIYKKN